MQFFLVVFSQKFFSWRWNNDAMSSGSLFSRIFSNDFCPADFFLVVFFSKIALCHCPSLLPIVRCPLAVACRPLPICHFPSVVALWLLPIGHRPSAIAVASWPLPVGRCPSAFAHRRLPVGHCPSAVAHRPLPISRCPSAVAHLP